MNKLIEMMLPFIILCLLRIVKEASGINSMIEIPIMITIDNDREKVIAFSTCFSFHLINMGSVPSRVDKPAMIDIDMGIKKDIESPI